MQDEEKNEATPDAKIASQARTWRRAEKRAIGERTSAAKDARYHELQKLREAVDTLGDR
jgi:hypothetical protein